MGDSVLRHFSDALSVNFGTWDQTTRLEGEEFLLVMPNTTLELARLKMHKLAMSLKPLPGNATHPPVQITFSAGLAIADAEESLATVLRRADGALYEAKQNGRNSVRIAVNLKAVDAA